MHALSHISQQVRAVRLQLLRTTTLVKITVSVLAVLNAGMLFAQLSFSCIICLGGTVPCHIRTVCVCHTALLCLPYCTAGAYSGAASSCFNCCSLHCSEGGNPAAASAKEDERYKRHITYTRRVAESSAAQSDAQHVRAVGMQAQPHRRFMLNTVAVSPEIGQGCVGALAQLEHLPGTEADDNTLEHQRRTAGSFCAASAAAAGVVRARGPAAAATKAESGEVTSAATAAVPVPAPAASANNDVVALQHRMHCAVANVLDHVPDWATAVLKLPPKAAAAETPESEAKTVRTWLKRAWQRINTAVTAVAATEHPQQPVRLLLLHLQQCGNVATRTSGTADGVAKLTAALCNTLVCIPGADAALGAAVHAVRTRVTASCSLQVPHIADGSMQAAAENALVSCCPKRIAKQNLVARCVQPGAQHALDLLLAAHAAVTVHDAAAKAEALNRLRATAQLAVEADPLVQRSIAAAAAAAAAADNDNADSEDEHSTPAASKPRKRARGVSGSDSGSSKKRSRTGTAGK